MHTWRSNKYVDALKLVCVKFMLCTFNHGSPDPDLSKTVLFNLFYNLLMGCPLGSASH